jgi:hypothetical protein
MTERSRTIGIAAGLVCWLAGLLVVAGQTVYWLRTGEWQPVTGMLLLLWNEIGPPTFSWVGFQKVVYWILEQPFSLVLVGFGVLVMFICAASED